MVEIKLRFEIYEKQQKALRLQKISSKGKIPSGNGVNGQILPGLGSHLRQYPRVGLSVLR